MSVPRGLIAGTFVATALVWVPYALIPGSSLLSAQMQTGIYLGLLVLTICSRRAKVLLARTLQRFVRWVTGIATVCPDDDPLARQRRIIAWPCCAR